MKGRVLLYKMGVCLKSCLKKEILDLKKKKNNRKNHDHRLKLIVTEKIKTRLIKLRKVCAACVLGGGEERGKKRQETQRYHLIFQNICIQNLFYYVYKTQDETQLYILKWCR